MSEIPTRTERTGQLPEPDCAEAAPMEVRRATHVYRLLRSSWGIRIAITGTVSIVTSGVADSRAGASPIPLSFSGSAARLPQAHRRELGEGFITVAPLLARYAQHRAHFVDVEDVQFNEADFQIEGLAVAMCRWAERMFDLPPRQILETFDSGARRYRFEWL